MADFRKAAATFRTGDGGTPPKLLVMHAEVSEGRCHVGSELAISVVAGSQKDEENRLRRLSLTLNFRDVEDLLDLLAERGIAVSYRNRMRPGILTKSI